MNPSHISFPHRRPPLLAWRLFLCIGATLAFSVSQAWAALIWQENFETVALGDVGPKLVRQGVSGHAIGVVNTQQRSGSKSLSLKLTYAPGGNTFRAEVVTTAPEATMAYDTEYWLGYSQYLKNWVTDTQPESILQAHASSTDNVPGVCVGPPDSFAGIVDDGNQSLQYDKLTANYCTQTSGSAFPGNTAWNGAVVSNQWVDWVMHFKFSSNGTGFYEIWRKLSTSSTWGPPVASVQNLSNAPTLMHPCCTPIDPALRVYHPKFGLYKWPWKNVAPVGFSSREMYMDDIKLWEGPGGSVAAVAPGGGGTAPVAPTGLTATPASSTQINLDWNPVSPTPTGYRVYRGATAGTVTTNVSGNLGSGTTAFNNTGLTPGQTYFYAARAYNSTSESVNSNIVSAQTSSGATNLAPNPGFETDPQVKYGTAGSGTFTWATDFFHGGARSVKNVSTQAAGARSEWSSDITAMAATPGSSYTASAWLRTATVTDHAVVLISFWNASQQVILPTTSSSNLTGTAGWTQKSVTATAPAGTAYVRVDFRLFGPGTLWADDVSVVKN